MQAFLSNNIIIDQFRFKIIQLIKTIEVSDISAEKKIRLDVIKSKVFFESPSLNDLCYAEKDLIEMCSAEQLDVLYREERCRYAKILPLESVNNLQYLDEYVDYGSQSGKTIIRKVKSSANDKSKRSKLLCVCGWIHEYYYFLIEKERFIGKVKKDLCILLVMLTLLSILYFSFCTLMEPLMQKINHTGFRGFSLILGMASAGYFGAVVSTVRRFQNMAIISADGIDRESFLLKLQQGVWGIYLSILLGATSPFVFFLLLNIISIGGKVSIMGVDFLPLFDKPLPSCLLNIDQGLFPSCPLNTDQGLFQSTRLQTTTDIAKVLFFSVLCGFSERLVPDVLDRMQNEVSNNVVKVKTTTSGNKGSKKS